MIPTKDIEERYSSATTGYQKQQVLASVELTVSAELIKLLTRIATDTGEFDLARVEAAKCLGLVAAKSPQDQDAIAETLVTLAVDDTDDDVRNYALMSLALLPKVAWVPKRIESLLRPEEYVLIRENAFAVLDAQRKNPEARRILKTLTIDPLFADSAKSLLEDGKG